MTLLVSIAVYAGLGFFAVGCLLRVLQYSRTPVHLRWELYPVPGEGGRRAAYGGSYFESSEWWTRPRKKHLVNEIVVMLKEIFLLHGIWKQNRRLWWRSYPFHTGLYLLVAACFLAAVGALTAHHSLSGLIFILAWICAWAGLLLTLIGSVSLAWLRTTDKNLSVQTVPGDLINLAGFALASLLLLAGGVSASMPPLNEAVYGLLTLRTDLHLPVLVSIGVIAGAAMVGYIPYTHMAHFIAKYFTYHAVRWDDAAKNKAIEAGITRNLALRPTWSAEHIGADGKRSWAEIATTNPERTSK
ncbi:MAG: respiratory nitrate reductase subunit gamma [Acidobacteriaceae bacterium]|nr:respiratory nitrate reductase subunit gamma [Acidobacteriaceae bacterium]